MLPILLEPACPVFVLRFVLFFSLVGALSPLARGTCYTSLPLALTLLLRVWPPSPPGYLQYLFQELYLQISNFSPSWPLSSQLISKNKNRLVPAILHSCWRSLSRWCVTSLSSRMPAPFSLTDGSSPIEALPVSLFWGTCYPSLSLALSIPLAPDLSLPLEPRILGLRVLCCRLPSTLAAIATSAVLSSFLQSVSHRR